jgi:predicted Zn-dependent peptidase
MANYQLSDFGVKFNKSKLENGVDVFGFYRAGMPVCIRVVFFSGSRFDTLPGTAHFLEHMLVAGTEKYPSKDKLAEPLERVGGSFLGQTNPDYIRLNVLIPQKEDLDIALEILEQMLWHSLFDEKVIENERGSILSEIGISEEKPEVVLMQDVYNPMIFRNTHLQNKNGGNKDSVVQITKQDLLEFKNKHFRAGNMIVLISGGANIDEYMPLLNKYLSKYPAEQYLSIPETTAADRKNFKGFKPYRENKQTYLRMGFRTAGMNENSRDDSSLDIIARVLGKGRSSRLLRELRYKKGLVYGVQAQNISYPEMGHLLITTSFENEKMQNVVDIILEQLKDLSIKEEELNFAKLSINKSFFIGLENSQSWLNYHQYEMMFNPKRCKTVDQYMNEIDSLTLEEVNKAAKKYLHKDNFYLALCGTDKEPAVSW